MKEKIQKTEQVHISKISAGDTIIHVDGNIRTVCKNNLSIGFMGRSLFGDSYKSGHTLVTRVLFKKWLKGEFIGYVAQP